MSLGGNVMNERLLKSHIETIYDSVGDSDGWSTLIERLVDDLNCRSGHISLEASDLSGIKQRYSKGISDQENQRVKDYFHKLDIFTQSLKRKQKGLFYSSQALVDNRIKKKSIIYNEMLLPIDIEYVTGALLEGNDNTHIRLGLHYTKKQGDSNDQLHYLNHLTPHLARAIKLHLRMEQYNSNQYGSRSLLDRLPMAVFLTDENAKVKYLNHRAETLLSETHSLQLHNGVLHSDIALAQSLNKAIFSAVCAAQGRPLGRFPHSIMLSNTQGLAEFELDVEPYSTFSQEFGFQYRHAMALVMVNELPVTNTLKMKTLTARYQLTQKETLLAKHLADGLSLDEISIQTHRTMNTLKTQLRSLFRKTDTSSQSQLVAKLWSDKH